MTRPNVAGTLPTSARRAQLVAACASVLVVIAVSPVTQGLYADPATQLKAVQQRLNGESTSINRLMRPDTGDLTRDTSEWIVWWTPGTEIVVSPLMRAGLSLGGSVRAIAAVSLVAGSIGWATWFASFGLPEPLVLGLSAVWPCVRIASNGLFLYSAEMLVFASAPWLLVATRGFLDRAGWVRPVEIAGASGLGLLLGAAYWLKGSLGFVAVGAIATVALVEWRRDPRHAGRALVLSGTVGVGAAVPFLGLAALNRLAGGGSASQVSAALQWHTPDWRTALDAIALPVLQMADADALWNYLLRHPAGPLVHDAAWISAIALPGGLVLIWLLARPRLGGAAPRMACCLCVVSVALLVGTWTISSAVSHEARHITSAAFAVLPLAIAEGRARWSTSAPFARASLAVASILYIGVPLAYGVTSVVEKVRRFPPGYRPGPARIYNTLLSASDVASVRDAMLGRTAPGDVWYLPEPISALDLPGRAIITGADFQPIEDLRQARFLTSRPLGIRALLPARFESNGKGPVIRASFPQAGPWASTAIAGSDYVLWTTHLQVTP